MRLLAPVLVALVTAAAAPAALAPPGLYGHVTRGPLTPVCTAEQPCSGPASGLTLRFTRGGSTVTTKTRPDGTYRVHLRAGLYSLAASSGRITPASVRVPQGRYAHVDFAVDTGIR